jgi:hypothetical protein
MIIKKKIWPSFFDDVLNGKKKFELRLDDFECNPGDILILEEWNPETKEYTGRKMEKKVSYVLKTKELKFWKKEDVDKYGLQIIGF